MCLWEDDGTPAGPYGVGGPNGYSLVYGQRRYLSEGRAHDDSPPQFCARPPRDDEPRDPAWAPHPDSLRNDLVLGWTTRLLTVEILSKVAALAGSDFSMADAATITARLPATDVYQGQFLEWRPSQAEPVDVQVASAPDDEDVAVRVVTHGDARLAELLRRLLDNAL